jgi:hypothetical protein
VRWASERRRQSCSAIALRRVKLGLSEEQARAEVGTAKVGASQIGSGEVGQIEVGAPEVSADEAGPPQAGACEIGVTQADADEVGSSVVGLRARYTGTHKLARGEQQGIDLRPVPFGIQLQKSLSRAACHGFRRRERAAQLTVDRAGGWQAQRGDQVPEQLMKLPHNGEHLVHLLCGLRAAAPVPPAESDLGNLLARAEAVIHVAAAEPAPSEIFVNTAPEGELQMGTGTPRRLVDREVGRSREPRCHAAQPETASAVSPERAVSAVAGRPRRPGFCAQRVASGTKEERCFRSQVKAWRSSSG